MPESEEGWINIHKKIVNLQKEVKDLKYEMILLKKFIYLDEEPLRKLYETYKKIEAGSDPDK